MTTPEHPSQPTSQQTPVTFHGAIPILRVRDLAASVDHYVRVLGFATDWHYPGSIASVSRDRCSVFLSEGDQGTSGTWAWIGVSDATALHDELRARGATIRQEPTNFAWALELQVEDPDGNVLRMGSDPRADVPFGPWKDMRGELWFATPEGGWRKAEDGRAENGTAEDGEARNEKAETPASPVSAAPVSAAPELKEAAEQARRAGNLPEARRLYEEAVALQRAGDDPLQLAHTVRHLGDVLREARLPHLAEPHYAEALAIYRAHAGEQPLNQANALRSHAILKHEMGDDVASRRSWEAAARLYQQLDQREGVAESAGWAARLAWRSGDLSKAREWLSAARAASDASSDPTAWKFVREVGLELGG
ncbi:tetratricopeptide repeat protein [Roseisolibacter agri]|uniref:VOC domain-containing protein n=1 Tax=Roseisolibacter agri TaxID=2014610 RepID=A0AA37Q8Q5_9BACT|nr:tetratricopeptide repeat protein [Roseisolibacter agri]GLC25787.1 hypothetical protein rosag_23000 [Roseisolibacter agri]